MLHSPQKSIRSPGRLRMSALIQKIKKRSEFDPRLNYPVSQE
jgi:hypothetical protein